MNLTSYRITNEKAIFSRK